MHVYSRSTVRVTGVSRQSPNAARLRVWYAIGKALLPKGMPRRSGARVIYTAMAEARRGPELQEGYGVVSKGSQPKGHSKAQDSLGFMYEGGQNVTQSDNEAAV